MEGQGNGAILVGLRIRPLSVDPSHASSPEPLAWTWDTDVKTITASAPPSSSTSAKQPYAFDHLYPPESSTAQIFSSLCLGIVHKSLEGFHGAVLAYGQTSSGKTFTMTGTQQAPGITPLAISALFARAAATTGRGFTFKVSYLEVYNEQIRDLLGNPNPPNPHQTATPTADDIRILSTPNGTIITGIREVPVMCEAEAMALLQRGDSCRHTGATGMNETSSRAHTLFRIVIDTCPLSPSSPSSSPSPSSSSSFSAAATTATLSLVDLAGSENAKMTGCDGERQKEAKFINQSLLTLSLIIQRLSEEASANAPNPTSNQNPNPASDPNPTPSALSPASPSPFPSLTSANPAPNMPPAPASSARRRASMTSHLPYRNSKVAPP